MELEVLLWKVLYVLLEFVTSGSCGYPMILCQLVVEGVLVFGASSSLLSSTLFCKRLAPWRLLWRMGCLWLLAALLKGLG